MNDLSTPLKSLIHALTFWAACLVSNAAFSQVLPQPASGRVERLAHFASQHVDARHVDVWLPDNFDALKASGQRFNVIYMHDGQMLFDARTTWNQQAWNVDRSITSLMQRGQIAPTLVVGIWNNGPLRHSEYFPQKYLQHMRPDAREQLIQKGLQGKPRSDAYLRFIVEELKSAIDARYPTLTAPANTVIMGSSMGGLISVYAMNEYPHIFGGAAGLSTHWIGGFEPNSHMPLAAYVYLRDKLAEPQNHRLYQDHGTTELDALYAPYQVFINQLVRDRGYTEQGPAANFMSRVFEGTGHNEAAWAERFETPVLFLLGHAPR
jgi:predicted alpha/beta superfamily hydrolase